MGKNELEAYREAEIQGSSPVELVLMLSDVLVRDIGRVIAAIGCGDIEDRVHRSSHAFEVLQQLEGLLDMENGGSTAEDLSRIYAHIRAKVMEAQFRLEPAILQKQIEMISQLREGWQRAAVTASTALSPRETRVSPERAANGYAGPIEEAQSFRWSA